MVKNMAHPGFNPVNWISHDKYLAASKVTKGVVSLEPVFSFLSSN